ncbi:hypothetical protein, partial [Actinomadura sp. CNU-125]|uniref:hypothetical protein n=1 Tax=Actinomadura sp. CNU-125 TaxID=1904961 RepID=UPI0021CD1152
MSEPPVLRAAGGRRSPPDAETGSSATPSRSTVSAPADERDGPRPAGPAMTTAVPVAASRCATAWAASPQGRRAVDQQQPRPGEQRLRERQQAPPRVRQALGGPVAQAAERREDVQDRAGGGIGIGVAVPPRACAVSAASIGRPRA